jgi:DNA polymerase-3 subunit epsilon
VTPAATSGRPLASLDIETTGTNQATDAIVSIGIVVGQKSYYHTFKPWKPIPPEVEKVIGITTVQAASFDPFLKHAKDIFDNWIFPNDLLGFNLIGFDVPLLWEEFYRCGIEWDLSNHLIIDAGNLWKKVEERTLEAAVKKFLGREHHGAHNSETDARATLEVFQALRSGFPKLAVMSGKELAQYSIYDDRKNSLTLDGKIVRGPDGDPIYNFGKQKGMKVKDDLGLAYWIMGKDFPSNTKNWLSNYLDNLNATPKLPLAS